MANAAKNYGLVKSLDELKALAKKLLADGKPVGFDVETGYSGPDREKGALFIDWDQQFVCGFSITNGTGWARYVPVAHEYGNNLPEYEAWEIIKPVLEELPIIAHNMKYELRNLRALERKGRGPRIDINVYSDSMIEAYVLNDWVSFGLKTLTKSIFGHEQVELKTLFPDATQKQLKALRFNILELSPEVVSYACEDAAWCLALHEHNYAKVTRERKFMFGLEMGILEVVADMEDAGNGVDWVEMRKHQSYAEAFHVSMEHAARKGLGQMAGRDLSALNFGSSKQMQDLLYGQAEGQLGLRTTRLTKSGAMSTDAIALEELSREHPAIKKALESREVKNLRGRLDKWVGEYSICYDGRVHPNFHQAKASDSYGDDGGVGAGRFAANDPAIQQLPKKWWWTTSLKADPKNKKHVAIIEEKGTNGKEYWAGNFRDFVVAEDGWYLLGYDYSQIELRVLAGVSQEPALLKAFNEDQDVHTLTASMMLGIPVAQVGEEDRAVGKTQNFALLYGMGAKSLAERLAITMDRAKELYAQYFAAFTLVTSWMEKARRDGIRKGYSETHFGRKYVIWELQNSNKAIYSKGERVCVNAPIQGGAADYMKIAMLRASKALKERGWWMTKVKMTNNLHDALTFEVHNSLDPREVREVLQAAVVFPVKGFPKIKADWELGQKWGSCPKWTDQDVEFDGTNWRLVDVTTSGASGGSGATAPTEPEPVVVKEIPEKVTDVPLREHNGEEVIAALVVEVSEMPEKEAFYKFVDLLSDNPGETVVIFRTPEGDAELDAFGTSLGVADQGRISMVLGGAQVYQPREAVDTASLSEGLSL